MIGQIQTELPLWLALIGVVLAIFLSWFAYAGRRNDMLFSKFQRIFLSVLRGLGFFFVFILLLGIFFRSEKRITQRPVFVVCADNSASMGSGTTNDTLSESLQSVVSNTQLSLADEFDVRSYLIGDRLREFDRLTLTDPVTDFSSAFNDLKTRHDYSSIAGMLLLTDGIPSAGASLDQVLAGLPFPISFLAVGDAAEAKDIRIEAVSGPDLVYLNSNFSIDIVVGSEAYHDDQARVIISNQQDIIVRDTLMEIDPVDGRGRISLDLSADSVGSAIWNVELVAPEGDHNPYNDSKRFVTQVIEDKSQVLLIFHQPHPDIRVISEIVNLTENLDLELWPLGYGQPDLASYDLVILFQLPDQAGSGIDWLSKLKESEVNTLVVVGPETALDHLSDQFDQVDLFAERRAIEDYGARINDQFPLFQFPEKISAFLEYVPPLKAPLAKISLTESYHTLLLQSIKGIPLSDPLVWFMRDGKRKLGFWWGEGLWRWYTYEYLHTDDHYHSSALIRSMINYLVIRDMEDQLIVEAPQVISSYESIRWKARVYNDSYELTTEPVLHMNLLPPDAAARTVEFRKLDNTYWFEIDRPAPGRYTYDCSVMIGGSEFTKSGLIDVLDIPFEQMDVRARFDDMSRIAEQKGGRFFTMEETGRIDSYIASLHSDDLSIRVSAQWISLLNWKYLLFIIIGIFTTEWVIRRFFGTR